MLIEYTWYGDYTDNEHKGALNYTTIARNVDEAIKDAQKRYQDVYSSTKRTLGVCMHIDFTKRRTY